MSWNGGHDSLFSVNPWELWSGVNEVYFDLLVCSVLCESDLIAYFFIQSLLHGFSPLRSQSTTQFGFVLVKVSSRGIVLHNLRYLPEVHNYSKPYTHGDSTGYWCYLFAFYIKQLKPPELLYVKTSVWSSLMDGGNVILSYIWKEKPKLARPWENNGAP